jgi:hypothetical protein
MLIAVGERLNNVPPGQFLGLHNIGWRVGMPWDAATAVRMPAFVGQELKVELYLGRSVDRMINLLSPSDRPGEWDSGEAEDIATHLHSWAAARPADLILLGRRVADAFGFIRRPFGSSFIIGPHSRALLLPHPSGRNRLLNDEEARAEVRQWVKEFA